MIGTDSCARGFENRAGMPTVMQVEMLVFSRTGGACRIVSLDDPASMRCLLFLFAQAGIQKIISVITNQSF
jgi:hypothetical protein